MKVKLDYGQWIADYHRRHPFLTGLCVAAAREMIKTFPELQLKRGWAETAGGRYEHAWCADPSGKIVDPTEAQFGVDQVVDYIEFQPGDTIRVGRCRECGDQIYAEVGDLDDSRYAKEFCDDQCRENFSASLMGEY